MSVCVCRNTPIAFAEKSAKPGLVKPVTPRADFSKTNTVSFTSVNLGFRAETQRHVNLRYFGGPRMHSKTGDQKWGSIRKGFINQ